MRWALALVGCFACFSPKPQPGAPCANGECPDGLKCSPATDTCELTAVDASITDSSVDAPRDAPPATIPMMVQQSTNYGSDVTSLSTTLPALPAAGRMLIMIGANVSGSLTTVSGGASWTMAARSLINSNIEIWFGVSDGSSATVTIARPNGAGQMWIAVTEWSGLATTNSLDVAAANFGDVNPVSAGSITTTNARDLLVFAATTQAPNVYLLPTPGTWTVMQGITNTFVQGEWYRVVTATGTFAPQTNQSGTAPWEAAIAALRIAP